MRGPRVLLTVLVALLVSTVSAISPRHIRPDRPCALHTRTVLGCRPEAVEQVHVAAYYCTRPAHEPKPRLVSVTPVKRGGGSEVTMRLGGGGFNRGGGGGFNPSSLVFPAVVLFLIGSGAFWNVIQFINGFFLFLILVPLIGGQLINLYLSSNLIEGACPECGFPQQVIKAAGRHQCTNCGSIMTTTRSESGIFLREGMRNDGGVVDVEGIIDVD